MLFSALIRDLALTMARRVGAPVYWSESVLGELRKNLVSYIERNGSPNGARRVENLIHEMNRAFPRALTTVDSTLDIGPAWPDPDDEHVVRGVLSAGATHIVTDNLGDFPTRRLAPLGLTAVSADRHLLLLLVTHRDEVLLSLEGWLWARSRPAYTRDSLIERLRAVGINSFAEALELVWVG